MDSLTLNEIPIAHKEYTSLPWFKILTSERCKGWCMMYSCEAVRALEEAVRGAKKAVQRSPDFESLLTLAEENLQVCNVN